MSVRRCHSQGYSLVELLVVLVIVGVMALAGAVMITYRQSGGVRSVMDEIEGTLMNAQKAAVVTSTDIYVATAGKWVGQTLILDGRALSLATVSSPLVAADLIAGADTKRLGSPAECFRSHYRSDRDHMVAGVDAGDGWYTTALGTASDLATIDPVKSDAAQVTAMGNPLFTGADNYIFLNGLTKRFEKGFSIVVVGLRGGAPIPNGPVGVIIVPANTASVYKYYKPDSSTTWRRM